MTVFADCLIDVQFLVQNLRAVWLVSFSAFKGTESAFGRDGRDADKRWDFGGAGVAQTAAMIV